jgi:hypothetical protein
MVSGLVEIERGPQAFFAVHHNFLATAPWHSAATVGADRNTLL